MQKSMYDEHLLSPLESNENKESPNPAATYSGKSATNSHLSPSISLVKPWLHKPTSVLGFSSTHPAAHEPAAAHQNGTTSLDVSLGLLSAAEAEGAQCRVKEKSHCRDTRGTAGREWALQQNGPLGPWEPTEEHGDLFCNEQSVLWRSEDVFTSDSRQDGQPAQKA